MFRWRQRAYRPVLSVVMIVVIRPDACLLRMRTHHRLPGVPIQGGVVAGSGPGDARCAAVGLPFARLAAMFPLQVRLAVGGFRWPCYFTYVCWHPVRSGVAGRSGRYIVIGYQSITWRVCYRHKCRPTRETSLPTSRIFQTTRKCFGAKLPPAAYVTSSELWQLGRERIFNRSWMLVAHVDKSPRPVTTASPCPSQGSRSWWCGTSTGSCTLFRQSAGTG